MTDARERFVRLPIRIVRLFENGELSLRQFALLTLLLGTADHRTRTARHERRDLLERFKCSEDTLLRDLKRLRERHLIDFEVFQGKRGAYMVVLTGAWIREHDDDGDADLGPADFRKAGTGVAEVTPDVRKEPGRSAEVTSAARNSDRPVVLGSKGVSSPSRLPQSRAPKTEDLQSGRPRPFSIRERPGRTAPPAAAAVRPGLDVFEECEGGCNRQFLRGFLAVIEGRNLCRSCQEQR
jgi:hypothetical protein